LDPITQGLLGAAAAQLVLQKRLGRRAWWYGALGGMAADLDVLIRDASDPLVAWVYHRHFTHSLAFIPVGGVIASIPWVFRKRFAAQRKLIVAATTVGYATHALLDAFTSYGTQLWWPFASTRVAWHAVGIIDPIFTGALFVGVLLTARRDRLRPVAIAMLFCAAYLGLGFIQRGRAVAEIERLAAARGDVPTRVEAMPFPLTNVVWRGLYAADGQVHAYGVHVPWFGAITSRYGGSIAHAREPSPEIAADPRTAKAFETFAWFCDGWVALEDEAHFVDLRFSSQVATARGMWGIELHPHGDPAVRAIDPRRTETEFGAFLDVVFRGFESAS
jgi:inner membrane protein